MVFVAGAQKTGWLRQTTQCSGWEPHLIGPSYVALRVRPCGLLVTSLAEDPWKPLCGRCLPADAPGSPLAAVGGPVDARTAQDAGDS